MIDQIKNVLAATPLVMVLPIGVEDDFKGVVDLLTRKAWVWDDTGLPENYEIRDVPEDMLELTEEWREKLIETALEQDDDAMEAYLEETPSLETLHACIRKGTIALDFFRHIAGLLLKQGYTAHSQCGG